MLQLFRERSKSHFRSYWKIPSSFVAPVCFWQVKWNTFVGHINGSSLKRVQEGPNHLVSGGTAAPRSCQRGNVGGTPGTRGRAAPWRGPQRWWAVLCRKRGDGARWGNQSPGLVGPWWIMLCIRLFLRYLCSLPLQRPWAAGYGAAEGRLWGLSPLLLQAELWLKRGSAVPCQCWELLHVLSLEVLCNSDLFLPQTEWLLLSCCMWWQLPTECCSVMGALRCVTHVKQKLLKEVLGGIFHMVSNSTWWDPSWLTLTRHQYCQVRFLVKSLKGQKIHQG